jgi:hypothetical protein
MLNRMVHQTASRFLKSRRLKLSSPNPLQISGCFASLRAQPLFNGISTSIVLKAVILPDYQSDFYLRASVGTSARTAALAPPRRIQAQSSRFQKTCLSNGGRKVVGGRSRIHSTPFGKSCKPEN